MILQGDCLEVMPTLEAESVDAVVTDPPYGLEFMGRSWDTFRPTERTNRGGDAGKGVRRVSGQAEIWTTPRPAVDPRPLETGGALVILRLSPAEVAGLTPFGPTLVEAVHLALTGIFPPGSAVLRNPPDAPVTYPHRR